MSYAYTKIIKWIVDVVGWTAFLSKWNSLREKTRQGTPARREQHKRAEMTVPNSDSALLRSTISTQPDFQRLTRSDHLPFIENRHLDSRIISECITLPTYLPKVDRSEAAINT